MSLQAQVLIFIIISYYSFLIIQKKNIVSKYRNELSQYINKILFRCVFEKQDEMKDNS